MALLALLATTDTRAWYRVCDRRDRAHLHALLGRIRAAGCGAACTHHPAQAVRLRFCRYCPVVFALAAGFIPPDYIGAPRRTATRTGKLPDGLCCPAVSTGRHPGVVLVDAGGGGDHRGVWAGETSPHPPAPSPCYGEGGNAQYGDGEACGDSAPLQIGEGLG